MFIVSSFKLRTFDGHTLGFAFVISAALFYFTLWASWGRVKQADDV